jgi:hypothetical protein
VLGQSRRALGDSEGAIRAFKEGVTAAEDLGMTAMALELEVAAAQVAADVGDVETAISQLEAIARRAEDAASPITLSWARTTLGWVRLRVDPAEALPLIDEALADARALEYPIGIAVNLRSRAFAHLLLGARAAAVADVSELVDDLIARGALSSLRLVADVTAAIAFVAGHPSWEPLVATARQLPISTMASSAFELVPIPATAAVPVGRHDVLSAVRGVLPELALLGPDAGVSDQITPPEGAATASIVLDEETCDIDFRTRSLTVRTSKGVVDLIRLIEAGGREVHCLDLAGALVEETSTGELLDAEARRRYEARIRELQDEIDDAERDNDYGRSYRHQVELDTIIDHLSAALAPGGRGRRAAGTAERARSAVTHRIRATIRQLDKLHPALGRHLAVSVTTGTYCSYRPEQPIDWQVVRRPGVPRPAMSG